MLLQKFGLILRRLEQNDIELVRQMRNSESISRFMMYREHITPEMQLKWFKSINNTNNFYFIIEYLGEKIGLVNDKNIDWIRKTSEGGLFIWEERYRNSIIPLLVSVCIIEMAFYVLNWEKSEVIVLKSNQQAIDYNLRLGFIIQDESENEIVKMVLTRENYELKAKKITEAAITLNQENSDMILTLEPQDFKSGLALFIERLLENSPAKLEQNIEGESKVYIHRHLL
jgi:RimJ/RimL family protein N-acetyltransferase